MSSTTNLYHDPEKGCPGCPLFRRHANVKGPVVWQCLAFAEYDNGLKFNDSHDVPGRLLCVPSGTPAPKYDPEKNDEDQQDCPLREHGVLVIGTS